MERTKDEEPNLAEELEKMGYEPILPVERKLVIGSIVLGLVLILLLMWVSRTFFPA